MLGFKVIINDEEYAMIGRADWSVLSINISAKKGDAKRRIDENIQLHASGVSEKNSEAISHRFRWAERNLEIGNRIEIEVVDTDKYDAPQKSYRSDCKEQENPFTDAEWKEMRYQDYLKLKAEFDE